MLTRAGRTLARSIVAILLGLLGSLTASADAAAPSKDTIAIHVYDTAIYDQPVDYAASERGPPSTQLVVGVAAGQSTVDHFLDGTSARPDIEASSLIYVYDDAASLMQVARGGHTGAEASGAAVGDLSSLQQGGVAANSGSRAPQALRVGELKLSAVPKGVVGTPTKTGKGLDYVIPRGTPELSERVASIRIMDPVTTGKNVYPNGYAVYTNAQGQRVNPLTGQMIHHLSDPFAHIPLP